MWGKIDDMVFQLTLQMIIRSLTAIEFIIKNGSVWRTKKSDINQKISHIESAVWYENPDKQIKINLKIQIFGSWERILWSINWKDRVTEKIWNYVSQRRRFLYTAWFKKKKWTQFRMSIFPELYMVCEWST